MQRSQNKVYIVKKLIGQNPLDGTVEDIVVISYRETGDDSPTISYTPYVIVRSKKDNKLYFTLDDYALIPAGKHIVKTTIGDIGSVSLFNNNDQPVKYGDKAYIYLYKIVSDKIKVDSENEWLYVNKRKYSFASTCGKVNIDDLKDMVIYKGFIDI